MDPPYYVSRRTKNHTTLGFALRSAKQMIVSTIWPLFVPTFMEACPETTADNTDWLHGLRGIAAILVVHWELAQSLSSEYDAGRGLEEGGEGRKALTTLPVLRLLFPGNFAIALALLICGYKLSLSITRSRRLDENVRALASSVLRQPIRLSCAAVASTILPFICIRAGLFEYAFTIFRQSVVLNGRVDRFAAIARRQPTLTSQLHDFLVSNLHMFSVSPGLSRPIQSYNSPLRVLPSIFQALGSLYVVHLLLLFMKPQFRSPGLILFMVLNILLQIPYGHLVLFGTLMADIDHARSSTNRGLGTRRARVYVILLLIGLFMGSMPDYRSESTPFYQFMGQHNPLLLASPSESWQHIGAMLTMLSVTRISMLRNFLSSNFSAYLGRISVSLYLCHLPVVTLHGTVIFDSFLKRAGWDNGVFTFVAFAAAYICTMIPVIYLADRFEELVDRKTVRLAASMEHLLMMPF
ncbi:hypothetical protein CKM354_000798600 [Cercospora kikuchii]|uniref:Acyltransferase 3 domain-containing protein n=1 Tax=Cercospora kikuchii TaxID=84275 RepID=A0A9P3CI30_9PEZI|nr:uncharacterized protein CKM354_000798600 [Cercospora kikuchii]GIZ44799.1 hypothetical protein CKM354_000798600 [Cercospora kikuchii]